MTNRKENDHGTKLSTNVFKRLMNYAKPYWARMLLASILVLILTGLELYRPVLEGNVIDEFITNRSFDNIMAIALRYVFVLIAFYICDFTQSMILQYTGQNIIYNIRQELYEHVHS